MGRRILITGLGTFWGGQIARELEGDPNVEVIVGLGSNEPRIELHRTEFVRADANYSLLSRIVRATGVDTVVHALLVDSHDVRIRNPHESNVIGTLNLLAAVADSQVTQVVVKSSTAVYGSSPRDPAWFAETMPRRTRPRNPVERSLVEAESYLRDFGEDNPQVTVAVLRFADTLGESSPSALADALRCAVVPGVFGFDPLVQCVEQEDVVRAMEHVIAGRVPGTYNIAGDDKLPWSEVAAICGKRIAPLPSLGTRLAAASLARLGIVHLPGELVDLLRYGRGVDNRRLKQTGFRYLYTSAGAVEKFAASERLRRTVGDPTPPYTYERDVEAFFRHSRAVVRDPG